MRTIYVAGASRQIHTVERYMRDLRAAGFGIAHDWCAEVRRQAEKGYEANPRDVDLFTRLRWATDDLAGACSADYFWLLIPEPESRSIGAWVELGAAISRNGRRNIVVVSGDWHSTIFAAHADRRFEQHQEAFDWLVGGLIPRGEQAASAA